MTPAERQIGNLGEALAFYGTVVARDGLRLIRSEVNLAVFNMALLEARLETRAELDEILTRAATHFEQYRTAWSFWVCADSLDARTRKDIDAIMEERDLRNVADTPGMELRGMTSAARALPRLEFREPRTRAVLDDFRLIVGDAFHVATEAAARLYANPGAWRPGTRGWVGYFDGQPVATSVAVIHSGVIGLYSVATLPEWRKRGCAESAVRHAMAVAAHESGLDHFVLQSSPAGRSLYRKMGFKTVTRFLVYASE